VSAFSRTMAVLKHETASLLPPTLYFLITFNVVVLTTDLVLDEFKVHVAFHASATILALVVGKVMLVVDKIGFIRRFDRKPLAYPILFKAVAYSLFVFAFRLLEHWALAETVKWRLFAMSQIWIFVLFLAYYTFAELVAAFGLSRRDLARVFFHEHPGQRADAT
jgi:hypothetical protein